MTSESQELIEAGESRYPRISEVNIRCALAIEDRTQAMTELRELGFSHEEIGQYYGVSRQRVEQLVPSGGRAAVKNKEKVEPDVLMWQIWEKACNDLSWWGPGGRLVKGFIVDAFLSQGFTYGRARDLARETNVSKLDVILRVSFGISPTHEDKIMWFKDKIETLSKAEIFTLINSKQVLQIPHHTFINVWRGLGLQVKIRKTHKGLSV